MMYKNNSTLINGVIVRPKDGMQLAEGSIHMDGGLNFEGCVPGLDTQRGKSLDVVLERLETTVKRFYGDDVIVELCKHRGTQGKGDLPCYG
jgi:hypothetical protein